MKINNKFRFPLICLLTITLLFSFLFIIAKPVTPCEHSICSYCKNIESQENDLEQIRSSHEECRDVICEICNYLEIKTTKLETAKNMQHTCVCVPCTNCLNFSYYKQNFDFIFIALFAIIATTSTLQIFRLLIHKSAKTLFSFRTLITLKVKLSN